MSLFVLLGKFGFLSFTFRPCLRFSYCGFFFLFLLFLICFSCFFLLPSGHYCRFFFLRLIFLRILILLVLFFVIIFFPDLRKNKQDNNKYNSKSHNNQPFCTSKCHGYITNHRYNKHNFLNRASQLLLCSPTICAQLIIQYHTAAIDTVYHIYILSAFLTDQNFISLFQFTAILLHCIGYGSLWQICLHIDIIHHHRSNPCKWWNQKTRRNHNGTKQDHINNRF